MKETKISGKEKSSKTTETVNIAACLTAGEKFLQNKDYYNANQQFRQVLSVDPKNATALAGIVTGLQALSDQARKDRDAQLTERYLEEAHSWCPENINISISLASVRYRNASARSVKPGFPIPEKKVQRVDNLIFQGGGIKGLAYPEAICELATHVDINQVKRFAGTSAGAIQACLLGLGYTLEECDRIVAEVDFPSFMDGEYRERLLALVADKEGAKEWTGMVKQDAKKAADSKQQPIQGLLGSAGLFRAKNNPYAQTLMEGLKILNGKDLGLFPGDLFREKILEKYIQARTGIPYATFRDLYQLRTEDPSFTHLKEMYFVGVNLNTKSSRVFSYETSPDVIVSDAVRISMSIPVIFHPHQVYVKTKEGQRVAEPSGHYYVDGGLLDNYPLWLFDHARYVLDDSSIEDYVLANPYSLGLRLLNASQITAYERGITPVVKISEGLGGFLLHLVETIYSKQNSDHVHRLENQRTIYIDNLGISAIEFNLPTSKVIQLRDQAKLGVVHFFDERKNLALVMKPMLDAIHSRSTQQVIHLFKIGIALPDTALDIAKGNNDWPMILTLVKLGAKNCTNPQEISVKLDEAMRSPWVDTTDLEKTVIAFKEYHALIESSVESSLGF